MSTIFLVKYFILRLPITQIPIKIANFCLAMVNVTTFKVTFSLNWCLLFSPHSIPQPS